MSKGVTARVSLTWFLAGLALVVLQLCLNYLSPAFEYERDLEAAPIFWLCGTMIAAGAIYLWIVRCVTASTTGSIRGKGKRKLPVAFLGFVVLTGLVLRLLFMTSVPILEDDHYRYLWDGAVWIHGFNPYAYAPQDINDSLNSPLDASVPEKLRQLADDSGTVIERINHPHLRTIYPPIAQVAFATAYLLKPWSLPAWRLVLLFCDLVILVLLFIILMDLKLPPLWAAVYWLNPLLVKEIYNSGHMDILLIPFVLGALYLASRKRPVWSSVLLALAAGIKLWPVLLVPLVLRNTLSRPGRLAAALVLFVLLTGIISVPVLEAGLDDTSGFTAYGSHWEMNDSLFMIIGWGVTVVLKVGEFDYSLWPRLTRLVVAVLLAAVTFLAVRKNPANKKAYYAKAFIIIAALFLLSPTQFPWYSLWFLPFLVFYPRCPLILLTALLPIYYLRFYFKSFGNVDLFDYGLVWLQYIPVWVMLILEWRKSHTLLFTPGIQRVVGK